MTHVLGAHMPGRVPRLLRLSPFHCHVCGLRGLNTGEPAVWGPQLVDQCLAMVIFHGILFEVHVILCEYSWINL